MLLPAMTSRFDKPLPPLPNDVAADQPTRNPPPPPAAAFAPINQRARTNSRSNGNPPQPHALQPHADSSSDSDDIGVPKAKRPGGRHNRSMSHPFPALFSSLGKKKTTQRAETSGPSSLGNGGNWPQKVQPHQRQLSAGGRKMPPGPADFATGNCMTCASMVRWPKELHVFRCTICLTINDLKPQSQESVSSADIPPPSTDARTQQDGAFNNTTNAPRPQRAPTSISPEHTKILIRQCLRSALLAYITGQPEDTPSPADSRRENMPSRPHDYFSHRKGSSYQPEMSPAPNTTAPLASQNKNNPVFDEANDVLLEPNPLQAATAAQRSYSSSFPDSRSSALPFRGRSQDEASPGQPPAEIDPKRIFKRLEDYLIACFNSHSCVNNSFISRRTSVNTKQRPGSSRRKPSEPQRQPSVPSEGPISELDPKLLLLGDFAENGSWWLGDREEPAAGRSLSPRKAEGPSIVTSKSPSIDWGVVMDWYQTIANAAQPWQQVYDGLAKADPARTLSESRLRQFENLALQAQEQLQRALLKCTEMLLKRPGRLMVEPQDMRFLLMILANPLITSGYASFTGRIQKTGKGKAAATGAAAERQHKPYSGRHSGIIKRVLGLISNSSEQCHQYLITWLSRLPEHLFLQLKDLVSGFVTYRLVRQNEKKLEPSFDVTGGLIPQFSDGRNGGNPASLHAALADTKSSKKQKQPVDTDRAAYTDDWQIKAGSRVLGLIFSANSLTYVRPAEDSGGCRHLLATSDFYNSLVDCLDFKADFDLWESKRGKFTLCQFPFLLSIWAKIQILEHDAKRQMRGKAREAFFDSILTHKTYAQYLVLNVRRECLVEDSLTKVSEVVGSGSEDIKKGLRIEFRGEEGYDAGGLRKEWFLLLVREVFNPDHGLFVYDDDSQACYFNPHTFETSDQYFLVGVVLGLAIYNSTILEIALPSFAFRKLLASAPPPASGMASHSRPTINYTLDDLAEYRPALAKGLRQLLEFDGDVESVFCLDFVVEIERYGSHVRVPLCVGGDGKSVTNANRREYVDLYVRYLLDTSVSRQFEPFKRGFFTVTAGNALSLFRPEEIELLVRGSDEPLDITSLKAVADYSQWPKGRDPETEPLIQWFWESFENATPKAQRKLLSFITGSDRIPATGAASLVIRINCLGDDEGRYPSARTCFNMLSLYSFASRERLEELLWGAVNESEGFGLR